MTKTAAMLLTFALWAPVSQSSTEPVPVIVELFTSEGCSSCPPADRLLAELHQQQPLEGVQVIALSQHVDYWDRLGWKDPFSGSQFTDRQRRYARLLRSPSVYTPQMVVDGRVEFVGSNRGTALAEIDRASHEPKGNIRIDMLSAPLEDGSSLELRIRLERLPDWCRKRADLYLALSEDGLSIQVPRGENQGRRLRHDAVVRRLERISKIALPLAQPDERTAKLELSPEWDRDNLRAVAFVQDASGRIAAAASLALKPAI